MTVLLEYTEYIDYFIRIYWAYVTVLLEYSATSFKSLQAKDSIEKTSIRTEILISICFFAVPLKSVYHSNNQ